MRPSTSELIDPAVKGTVGILQSALKNGYIRSSTSLSSSHPSHFSYSKSVKRIVITSSVAAVLHVDPEPQYFSELDWNEQAVQEVAEKGRDASAASKYRASKTLAEKGIIMSQLQHMWLTPLKPPGPSPSHTSPKYPGTSPRSIPRSY
jgi:nucleoside-diphosphate-sugar epimerase